MNGQALKAEWIKMKRARIRWVTFVAFSLAPVLGGVFILIIRDPVALSKSGAFSTKAQVMNFSADWNSYLMLLKQAVGVGGILVFGFVASWIFGREYSDGTAKDLLSLPTSRARILNAKFVVYAVWCAALAVSNLLTGFLIGSILQLPAPETSVVLGHLNDYCLTTLLTVLLGTPIAFFALWGKGYLAPLAFVSLTLVFAQVIAATGYGSYFPWSVPGLFSGAAGSYKEQLDIVSYSILVGTSIAGYTATVMFWRYADQNK
ncbi:MAG: ABC transporter permease [Saprospiraceae bacterium]|nr:ABC transporter permease [Saprospiraceae bacterium]